MPRVNEFKRRTARAVAAAAVATALISGCGAVNWIKNDGVSDPITPEQSKAQVVDAAKEIVGTLNLAVIKPVFYRGSCNDQREPPFRGQATIGYPKASSFEVSDAEVVEWVKKLQTKGWAADDEFKTHATALTKNGVTVAFQPQNNAIDTRVVYLYGECRDMTTTKETSGGNEPIDLSSP